MRILVLMCIFVISNIAFARGNIYAFMYPSFPKIKSVGGINVVLEGTAKYLVNKSDLTKFLKLKVKNDLPDIPFKKVTKKIPVIDLNKYLYVTEVIDCYGTKYPIAITIQLKVGDFSTILSCPQYGTKVLGIINRKKIESAVKVS